MVRRVAVESWPDSTAVGAVGATTAATMATAALPKQPLLVQLSLCTATGCEMVWKPFTAIGEGVDTSPLPTHIPPAPPVQQWLRRRRVWVNPSIPSSPQQDPSVSSLCHTLMKAVYLFGFFSSYAVSPCHLLGTILPSYTQAGPLCFRCKSTLLFLLLPRAQLAFPSTHTLCPHQPPQVQ